MDDEPGRFAVFVYYPMGKGKPKGRTRIGNFKTLELARKCAEDNERECRSPNTYGGLIGWPKDEGGRSYRIFEATGWKEHSVG